MRVGVERTNRYRGIIDLREVEEEGRMIIEQDGGGVPVKKSMRQAGKLL